MNTIIVDDDPVCIRTLQCLIKKRNDICVTGTFTNSVDALKYLENNPVELVFLDVEMPDLSGIELIKSLDQRPSIIITSGSKEFACDAYDLDVQDYILKPLSFERLNRSINKMKRKTLPAKENTGNIFIKINNQVLKISKSDIFYIEADGDYVIIYTSNNKYILNLTMRVIEEILQDGNFARIHRSFIVAVDKIEKIVDNKVSIRSEKLPIGNSFRNNFMTLLNVI